MSLQDDIRDEFLRSIALKGSIDANTSVIIASRSHAMALLNLSSGLPRFASRVIPKFDLIISQPEILQAINPFQIRCCLCNIVITYPCWYHNVNYAVNHMHYFVCFDRFSPTKVTTKCFRREG